MTAVRFKYLALLFLVLLLWLLAGCQTKPALEPSAGPSPATIAAATSCEDDPGFSPPTMTTSNQLDELLWAYALELRAIVAACHQVQQLSTHETAP